MKFPIFLFALVLFTAALALKRKKQTQNQENANQAFLEREREANATRKKDISHLNYLSFSLNQLPMGKSTDELLLSYESILQKLSDKKIMNLSAYSNTDLKLMYGPANLNDLSEYDDNYHTLASTLLSYAKREIELEQTDAAITILEYAMSLAIDSSQIYLLLAELYQKENASDKILNIVNTVSAMDEPFASRVLPKLKSFHTDV